MSVKVIKTAEGETAVTPGSLFAEEHEILYVVSGAPNRRTAFAAVDAEAPAKYDTLVKKRLRFEKYTGEDMEISVSYGRSESNRMSDKAKVSFDTSGENQHIIKGKALVASSCPGTMKYNPGPFIGWNGKSGSETEYTGIDIIVPHIRKTVVQTISKPTTSYENIVIELTGTVNSRNFLGRERGEVLFLGATWTSSGGNTVDATYHFAIRISEYVKGLGIKKKGWEYLWEICNTGSETANQPVSVGVAGIFLSQVYTESNFGKLGIRA